MLETFINTLMPTLSLFLCIAIGFTLKKCKLLPENAGKTMAKLENWVFCPALSFATLSRAFTIKNLSANMTTLGFSCLFGAIALALAIPLSKLFVPKKEYERGVYQYALAFGNLSYMGDPIALALFGEAGLANYKIFTLPLIIIIYTWGISALVPKDKTSGNPLKNLLNPSMVASFVGMVVGIVGLGGENSILGNKLPFLVNTIDSLKVSMGPMAMLLAGYTVASYDMKKMLKNKKVYIATFLRLLVFPVVFVGVTFLVKQLVGVSGNGLLFVAFTAAAMPLGLNTIVFPEAYGGNAETGASMATISHSLCVVTIPILYAIMIALFGTPVF